MKLLKDQMITCKHAIFGLKFFSMVTAFGLLGIGSMSANAAIINLTTTNSEGTSGGAIFKQNDTNETSGTGSLDPFVRIQSNQLQTQGFNTSLGPMSQVNTSPNFTRDFQLSSLNDQIVNISGTDYYQFILDINEPNSNPEFLLTIQTLEIRTSSTQLDFTNLATDQQKQSFLFNNSTGRYSLGGDSILLNANLESGSGRADMLALIPVSFFSTAMQTDWVYLYTTFGWLTNTQGWPAGSQQNGNFEEWGTIKGGVVIPEPSTYIFGFLVVGALVWQERSRITAIARKFAVLN